MEIAKQHMDDLLVDEMEKCNMEMEKAINEKLMNIILKRIYDNGKRFNGKLPFCEMDSEGRYILTEGGHWIDSFWVGIFYLAYSYTGDERYIEIADRYQPFFKEREANDPEICSKKKYVPLDHDAGFIFSLSQVARYKLLKDSEARTIALSAARRLAGRFNEKGQFIRAFDTWSWDTDENFIDEKKGKIIIDTMMNLPLLLWAYSETKEEYFKDIAIGHARTAAKYIVRKDYSTYHQYNFNPETGDPLRGLTGQGYHDESCWSRGQAWAIYGFALIYGYTGEDFFLTTAERTAEYFINNLGNHYVPLWDFDVKDCIYRPWDSSAGAIAASGILEVSKYLHDNNAKFRLISAAEKILYNLIKLCGTFEVEGYEPLLLHGCIGPAYKKGNEKQLAGIHNDVPTVYGDYFFVEALMKCQNPQFKLFW